MNRNRILAAVFAGIATLALAATDASADGGHGHGRHKGKGHGHKHVVRERVVYAPGPAFTVPHRIAYREYGHYDRYSHRRHWDGHRRSWVTTYQFPVVVRGAVVYRPFTYCDGVLVGAYPGFAVAPYGYGYAYDDVYYRYDDRVNGYVTFRGPNVSVGIGF